MVASSGKTRPETSAPSPRPRALPSSLLFALALAAAHNLFLVRAYPLGLTGGLEAAALFLAFTLLETALLFLGVSVVAWGLQRASAHLHPSVAAALRAERLRWLGLGAAAIVYVLNSFVLGGSRREVLVFDLALLAGLTVLSLLFALRAGAPRREGRLSPSSAARVAGVLLAGGAIAAAVASPRVQSTADASRPPAGLSPPPRLAGANVVLVVIDTMRADRLSWLGSARETTPELDRLAERAVVFTHARANATRTSPSMASLVTGTSPLDHGIVESRSRLPDGLPTLAESLRRAGYRTIGVLGNVNLGQPFGFTRGLDEADEAFRAGKIDAATLVDRAVARLPPAGSGPFFLWLQLMDPHAPYRPPAEHLARFRADPVWGASPRAPLRAADGRSIVPEHARIRDASSLADYVAAYDASVRAADQQLGRLWTALANREDERETLVVVTSDHGESLGERGRYFVHGLEAYEETARVPLLFAHPGLPPGRVDAPVSLMDVAPSVLALVAGPDLRLGEGRDLFEGGAQETSGALAVMVAGTPRFRTLAVTDGRWKLHLIPRPWREADRLAVLKLATWPGPLRGQPLRHRSYRHELYDLAGDPFERTDLAGTGLEAERRLLTALLARIDRSPGRLVEPLGARELRDEEILELKALGYL